MSRRHLPTVVFLLGALAGALLGAARADDSEIFYSANNQGGGANVMLVVDTSLSMNDQVPASTYDQNTTYTAAGCDPNSIYFLSGSNQATASTCATASGLPHVAAANYQCTSGIAGLNDGSYGPDNYARYNATAWTSALSSTATTQDVACKADWNNGNPVANAGNSTTSRFPAKSGGEWTTNKASSSVYWGSSAGTSYTAYSGNYLAYLANGGTANTVTLPKITVVENALVKIIPTLPSSWNVGLMTYNYPNGTPASSRQTCGNQSQITGYGGCVILPFTSMASSGAVTTLQNAVKALKATGDTPLVGTMYEAYLYFQGLAEYYGRNVSTLSSSVNNAGTTYLFPPANTNYTAGCTKNFVIFLTDGLPNEPTSGASAPDSLIKSLAGANSCTDGSLIPSQSQCQGGSPINGGTCLSALTGYMASTKPQTPVQTYFLAFGSDSCLMLGFNYLQNAAAKGGGSAYLVPDADTLTTSLNSISTQILQIATSFTAPTVAVNAFNRTQTLNDLYISMFEPNTDYHWAGNIKHYTLSTSGTTTGQIVDSTGTSAVANGFIASTARSTYAGQVTTDVNGNPTSTSMNPADGSTVDLGGAADLIPSWQQRQVFTYIGANPGAGGVTLGNASSGNPYQSTSSYQLAATNPSLTKTLVGIPSSDTTTTLANVVNYARGADLYNVIGKNTSSFTGSRLQMGDALHGQPSYVFYGDPNNPSNNSTANAYIYATENDGFLHAINAYTGAELWSFVPQGALGSLYTLYQNAPFQGPPKHYTLDGSVQVLKYDQNGDGVIESGDRVIIYFSDGRAGSNYYALDVTNPQAPIYLWSIGPSQLKGVGQTWSTPTIARVNTGLAAQVSNQKLVLIFGGGYDPNEDGGYYAADSVGNTIFMVDAVSGALLWQGILSGASTNAPVSTQFGAMDHAFPAEVAVLDTNADGYADRMYAADLAGQVWRFDITNHSSSASFGVAGGVLAALGTKSTTDTANQRRFYTTPDVALIQQPGQPMYFDLALGSGYRGHPLSIGVSDRMYGIRDFSPLKPMTASQYASLTPITGGPSSGACNATTLADITAQVNAEVSGGAAPAVPSSCAGWQFDLSASTGEKILSNASTFNNQVLFSTYTPASSSSASACSVPQVGTNNFYALSVVNGGTVSALNGVTHITMKQTGIAPPLTYLFPTTGGGSGGSSGTGGGSSGGGTGTGGGAGSGAQQRIVCTSGVEVLSACKSFNTIIKTYWTESDAR